MNWRVNAHAIASVAAKRVAVTMARRGARRRDEAVIRGYGVPLNLLLFYRAGSDREQ